MSGGGEEEPKVYTLEDQILTEVEVGEEPPDEDDVSTVWSDTGDDVEEGFEEMNPDQEAVEMAVAVFNGHSDCVYCAEVHPTRPGVVVSGGGDDTAYLWRYESQDDSVGQGSIVESIRLAGHSDTVSSVGFNYDGTLVLTASYDGTVRIWDSTTGEFSRSLDGPEDIEWAEWHSKGNAVVAGSKDGTIWMWLAHSGQCVQVFAGHDGAVNCGGFTKDGKFIISGGEDGSVRIWAPKTGQCKHVFDGKVGLEAPVTCLSNSTDGDLVLSGSVDGTVKLLQISGKRVLQTFVHAAPATSSRREDHGPAAASTDDVDGDELDDEFDADENDGEGVESVECLGFSSGEFRWAASGGMDKTLKIWDITTGSCRTVCTHGASVVSLSWHISQPILTTAALDNIVRVWDARTGSLLSEFTGHLNLVTSVIMRPMWGSVGRESGDHSPFSTRASDLIVSVSDDKSVRVFHYVQSP